MTSLAQIATLPWARLLSPTPAAFSRKGAPGRGARRLPVSRVATRLGLAPARRPPRSKLMQERSGFALLHFKCIEVDSQRSDCWPERFHSDASSASPRSELGPLIPIIGSDFRGRTANQAPELEGSSFFAARARLRFLARSRPFSERPPQSSRREAPATAARPPTSWICAEPSGRPCRPCGGFP